MKLFSALAVGVLAAGAAFGASIIDPDAFNTLCSGAGASCDPIVFNNQTEVNDNLFITTVGGDLVARPFTSIDGNGDPAPFYYGGNPAIPNEGNGVLSDAEGSFINIGFDNGPITAFQVTVDQGIANDGQGLLFTLIFAGGGTQNIANFDGCVGPGPTFAEISCPNVLTVQAGTGNDAIEFIRISNYTNSVGPENFNFYNMRIILDEEGEVDPGPNPEIPEPTTFGLMGAALLGLGAFRKFRK